MSYGYSALTEEAKDSYMHSPVQWVDEMVNSFVPVRIKAIIHTNTIQLNLSFYTYKISGEILEKLLIGIPMHGSKDAEDISSTFISRP